MKISFKEIKQAFTDFHPRELMEYGITIPFKVTAGILQGVGVGCFAKAAGVNLQIMINNSPYATDCSA